MTKYYISIMMAVLLTACGHRASKWTVSNGDSIQVDTLTIDSISKVKEDSIAQVHIRVDWPTSGEKALLTAIRKYISEELAYSPMMEEKPVAKYVDDGHVAADSALARHYQVLAAMWKDIADMNFPYDMTYTYSVSIIKQEETDRYITYLTNSEGYTGGAHGFATSTGQTFRRSDGKRIGYHMDYDAVKEKYVVSEQNMFKDMASPALHALIKEGVREYFKMGMEADINDIQLKDMLQTVDDVDNIPLPVNPPTFTSKGLSFVYQQYEIAAYAAGMINFNVAYDKVKPYLTKDAAMMVP